MKHINATTTVTLMKDKWILLDIISDDHAVTMMVPPADVDYDDLLQMVDPQAVEG